MFDHPDTASLREYNIKLFQEAQDEINDHIVYLGGNVTYNKMETSNSMRVNTGGEKSHKPPGLDKDEEDKYDPTKVQSMIDFIKSERASQLEGKIADR